MKKLIQKILVLSLVVNFLITTIGLHITRHHCNMSGSTDFYITTVQQSDNANCCMQEIIEDNTGSCCSSNMLSLTQERFGIENSCCSNTEQLVQIVDNYIPTPTSVIDISKDFANVSIERINCTSLHAVITDNCSLNMGERPPLINVSYLPIVNCCFLL